MQLQQIRRSKLAVVGIKAVHTLAWFSVESGMIYLLYTGLRKRSDRRAAIAAAVVGAESLIFAANGFRCPLSTLAEQFGAERGSVTDIYLPGWFAHNLPAIHVPLLVLAAFLHVKNFEAGRLDAAPIRELDVHDDHGLTSPLCPLDRRKFDGEAHKGPAEAGTFVGVILPEHPLP